MFPSFFFFLLHLCFLFVFCMLPFLSFFSFVCILFSFSSFLFFFCLNPLFSISGLHAFFFSFFFLFFFLYSFHFPFFSPILSHKDPFDICCWKLSPKPPLSSQSSSFQAIHILRSSYQPVFHLSLLHLVTSQLGKLTNICQFSVTAWKQGQRLVAASRRADW